MTRPPLLVRPELIVSLAEDLSRLEAGDLDILGALVDAPVISDWRFTPYVTSSLVGAVTGHPILGDRPFVATSGLYAIDPDAGWARTLSRWYGLGRRAGVRIDG